METNKSVYTTARNFEENDVELRASNSTSKAIFYIIIKRKKAMKIYLEYAKTYRDKIYLKPP